MSDLATASSPAETISLPSWHGSFIWYELLTTDQDAAIRFYQNVVGWSAADQTMADPSMQPDHGNMPFDGMRMFWGGFEPVVDTASSQTHAQTQREPA